MGDNQRELFIVQRSVSMICRMIPRQNRRPLETVLSLDEEIKDIDTRHKGKFGSKRVVVAS